MPLQEYQAVVTAGGTGNHIAVVLDASESALPHQAEIITLGQQVLERLPARVKRTLYFLGNAAPYPTGRFTPQAHRWCKENQRRASLLSPILTALPSGEDFTLVIIGSGSVFDLEEAGTLLSRTLLVSVGESLQDHQALAEEIFSPVPQDLLHRLDDPVTRIQLSGPGFMPTFWDHTDYQLQLTGGSAILSCGALKDKEYTTPLRFFAPDPGAVEVETTRVSGERAVSSLRLIEAASSPLLQSGRLEPHEAEILQCALEKRDFQCRYGKPHAWNDLECLHGGSFLGEPIYPSLERSAETPLGFVTLQPDATGVTFTRYPCGVLRVGPESVAVMEGPRANLYQFDASRETWVRQQPIEPYYVLEEAGYVIVL